MVLSLCQYLDEENLHVDWLAGNMSHEYIQGFSYLILMRFLSIFFKRWIALWPGSSALHYAASAGKMEVALKLRSMSCGAEPNRQSTFGSTQLHYAVYM